MTVKIHKHAIQFLKQEIENLRTKKREATEQIESLGRHPETGPERSSIRTQYVTGARPLAREAHIAMGLLRGRAYSVMEKRCHEVPNIYRIFRAMHEAFDSHKETAEELKAAWPLERIRALIQVSATQQAAEAA